MKKITLTKGLTALVDDENFDYLNQFTWCSCGKKGKEYAFRMQWNKLTKEYNSISMHRLVMKAGTGEMVDHKNGFRLDNRKENLRFCTHSTNLMNSRKRLGCSSKNKGVYCDVRRRKKWNAYINFNGKRIHLGCHTTETEAAIAHNKKAKELFGEFSLINRSDL